MSGNEPIITGDGVMIAAIKPHPYRGALVGHIAIQAKTGPLVTAYLTEAEALNLAAILLPDGYAIVTRETTP
jgi:hypothetical protein